MACLNRYINYPQLGESLSLSAPSYRDFIGTVPAYLAIGICCIHLKHIKSQVFFLIDYDFMFRHEIELA